MIEPLAALIPGTLPRRNRLGQAKRFLQVAGQPAARALPALGRPTSRPSRSKRLYTPEFRADLAGHDGEAWLLAPVRRRPARGLDRLDALLATDVRSYLPYDLLVKMDIATMASSLEARSPLPGPQGDGVRRPAAGPLQAARDDAEIPAQEGRRELLPAENLDRRKMGFGVPVGDWMRGELRPLLDDVLLSPRALARGYFRPEAVRQLVQEHVRRDRTIIPINSGPCSGFELWHREFLD